jgi:hypothetical protein
MYYINTGIRPDLPEETLFDVEFADGSSMERLRAPTNLHWNILGINTDIVKWKAVYVPASMSTSEVF